MKTLKTILPRNVLEGTIGEMPRACIFPLTLNANDLIYESHCDLLKIANSDVRENQSMKNATKKAAKKAPAKKAAAKKKK